ncbi:MAG TPA: hypothetical protein HA263_07655 [Methanoregulaceae archaeon]|nr:hypothetical protein [Methanoregulaceae archaeon]
MTRSITAFGPPGWIIPPIVTVWLLTSGGLRVRTGGPIVATGVGPTVSDGWVVTGGVVVGAVVASVGPLTKIVMDLVVDCPSLWNAVTVIVYEPIPA